MGEEQATIEIKYTFTGQGLKIIDCPRKCPECDGRGWSWYLIPPTGYGPKKCRRCKGKNLRHVV